MEGLSLKEGNELQGKAFHYLACYNNHRYIIGDLLGSSFEELSNETPEIVAVLGRYWWVGSSERGNMICHLHVTNWISDNESFTGNDTRTMKSFNLPDNL